MNEKVANFISDNLYDLYQNFDIDFRTWTVGEFLLRLNKELRYRDVFDIPRVSLSKQMGMSHNTFNDIVNELVSREIIYHISDAVGRGQSRRISFIKQKSTMSPQTPSKSAKKDESALTWAEEILGVSTDTNQTQST